MSKPEWKLQTRMFTEWAVAEEKASLSSYTVEMMDDEMAGKNTGKK